MIALGRHVVQMDFEHLSAGLLLSVGGLMTALAVSYFVIKKAHELDRREKDAR